MASPFLLLFPVLFLFPLIAGTILGWLSANQIRQSEGQLYGLRLAAFAGMSFPTLLLIVTPVAMSAIALRIASFSLGFQKADALIVVVAIFVTFGLLNGKIFQASLRKILGKGNFRERLSWKRNRLPLVTLALLWIGVGVIFLIQRPREIDENAVSSESPDQMYSVTASTWQQMRIFSSDRTFYRFELQGRGGTINESWDIPIPKAKLAKDYLTSPISEYLFEKKGSIQWKKNNAKVQFVVNEIEVFEILLAELEQDLSGSTTFSENTIKDIGVLPSIEAQPMRKSAETKNSSIK